MAGLLRDLGKMQVPDEVLEKPGQLDEEELSFMPHHSFASYRILKRQAAIIIVADIFQALAQSMPYRGPQTPEVIFAFLQKGAREGRLDEEIVDLVASNLDVCFEQATIFDGVVKNPISCVAGFWQLLDIPYV